MHKFRAFGLVFLGFAIAATLVLAKADYTAGLLAAAAASSTNQQQVVESVDIQGNRRCGMKTYFITSRLVLATFTTRPHWTRPPRAFIA